MKAPKTHCCPSDKKSCLADKIDKMKQGMPHWAWVAVSGAFALLCLVAVALLFFSLGHVLFYSNKVRFSISLFSTLGTMCILWGLFKRYSLIFWIPFMVFACGQVLTYWWYGAFINHSLVLAEILEGTQDEIMAYVTPFNIAMVCVLSLFSVFLGYVLSCSMRPFKRWHLLLLGVVCGLIVTQKYAKSADTVRAIRSMWPLSEFYLFHANIEEARHFNKWLSSGIEGLPSPAELPSSSTVLQPNSGAVIVLHVGESVRADRLSLNGYSNNGRSTTPWLDSQKGQSLINFSDCIAAHYTTVYSVLTILSDARRASLASGEGLGADLGVSIEVDPEMGAKSGSVLDLFAANQFSVYSFQGKLSGQELRFDKIFRMLTKSVKERHHVVRKPLENIPQMKKVLDAEPNGNLFFYVSNEGSHVPFDCYEDEYAPFQPVRNDFSNPSVNGEKISNAYDNTIYYTDEYIRRAVEQLKGRPFVYIYVSDHGEYLGHDGGLWGRGGVFDTYHKTSGCRVGMFVITSPEFEALHPHFAEAVKNLRAHADMTVGHEHIYHTLLGMVGIETPYYNAALDLSSESPEPYTGPQPDKD